MTKADRWKKRPCVLRYFAFKDECRKNGVYIPNHGARVDFVLPMPKSWSIKKKQQMNGGPHQQKPDLDNLLKAVLDAVYIDDCGVYDISCSKRWGYEGRIIVSDGGF